MVETCPNCGKVHEMIRIAERPDGDGSIITVGKLETSGRFYHEGLPVYCGAWMQEVLCLRRQLAQEREKRETAEAMCAAMREAIDKAVVAWGNGTYADALDVLEPLRKADKPGQILLDELRQLRAQHAEPLIWHDCPAGNKIRTWSRLLCSQCVDKRDAKNFNARQEIERLRARFTLPIVCICGSTSFADEHAIARWMLERDGSHICLMINYLPVWYADEQGWEGHDHFGEKAGAKVKVALDELHKRKLDLCDWVLVIAPEGYVGESTRAEIAYGKELGKPIRYIELGVEAAEAAKEPTPAEPPPPSEPTV